MSKCDVCGVRDSVRTVVRGGSEVDLCSECGDYDPPPAELGGRPNGTTQVATVFEVRTDYMVGVRCGDGTVYWFTPTLIAPALRGSALKEGDRVVITYLIGVSYGLWHISARAE